MLNAVPLQHFRHLLVEHELGKPLSAFLTGKLNRVGPILQGRNILSATLIAVRSSPMNANGIRDSEARQTKKCNQWYPVIQAHTEADFGTGYVQSIADIAAKTCDQEPTAQLVRGVDEIVRTYAGCHDVASPQRWWSVSLREPEPPWCSAIPEENQIPRFLKNPLSQVNKLFVNVDAKAFLFSESSASTSEVERLESITQCGLKPKLAKSYEDCLTYEHTCGGYAIPLMRCIFLRPDLCPCEKGLIYCVTLCLKSCK